MQRVNMLNRRCQQISMLKRISSMMMSLGYAWCRVLLLGCIVLTASAHEHAGSRHSAMAASVTNRVGQASAVIDAQGALWVVQQDNHGVIVVRRSVDQGQTWSASVPVTSSPEVIDRGGDARPKIAVAPSGVVYVTWTRPLAKPYTGEIRFSRSVDQGTSFSAPIIVHADRQQITHRFDALTVNAQGQVFVAWIDKRDGEALRGKGTYRGAAVYWAVSDDQGTSFRGDYKLADHSCECCRIALLPQADGQVQALWRHVFAPNIRDHALSVLHASGQSGRITRATFDDWKVDVCPHHGPSLARDAAGRLHAVWFSGGAEKSRVFYGRLRESRLEAPPASRAEVQLAPRVEGQRAIGAGRAEHADVAASGNRIVIAWKEFDGQRGQLRAQRSDDGGLQWREFSLASTEGPSGQPQVLVHDGKFFVFWPRLEAPLGVVPVPTAPSVQAFDASSFTQLRAQHPGQPFVLTFWSTTCAPCRDEMRVLKQLKEHFPQLAIHVVSTDLPDQQAQVLTFLSRYDPGPVVRWQFSDAFVERVRYSVDPNWRGELPRTYLFNAQHVAQAVSGTMRYAQLAQWAQQQRHP